MNKTDLYRNHWSKLSAGRTDFYVSGWAQYENVVLDNVALAEIAIRSGLTSFDKFTKFISKLNGNYSIIASFPGVTFIGADKMRGYPIIYFQHNGEWVITDDILQYCKSNSLNLDLDESIVEQFLVSDFVFGPYTVYKNVFSIQAGETVAIYHGDKLAERNQYFKWLPNMGNSPKLDLKDEAEKQDKIFLSVFKRMIKSAPNINNWLIPLSGGYDSRVIVNYLYKLGIKNVICFSYGIKGNIQAEISKQVAEALGYQWYFVDFLEWVPKLKNTDHISEYLNYGFNGVSEASLSHVPFLFALKEMNIAKKNDIVVPGHALEVLAGNLLDKNSLKCITIDDAVLTVNKHFSGLGYYKRKRKNVVLQVNEIVKNYNIDFKQVAEFFNWQERQTKFIANSVKVYEYFGLGWRIPEWDNELFEYWSELGFNYRYHRQMFKYIFKTYLTAEPLISVQFANDILEKKSKHESIKSIIINKLPITIKKKMKEIGFGGQIEYKNEGYNLMFSEHTETIHDYINNNALPSNIKKYLQVYPRNQEIRTLNVNSITTLINVGKLFLKN